MLVGLDFIEVLAHQVARLLLSIEVFRHLRPGLRLLALYYALEAVIVLHEHLLMMGFALDGVPGSHESRHLFEDLELVAKFRVFHDEKVRPKKRDVLKLLRVAPISNFLLGMPSAPTPALTDQRTVAVITKSQLF